MRDRKCKKRCWASANSVQCADFKTLIENRRSEGKVAKKKQEFREIRNKVEAAGGKMPRGNADAGVAALGKDDRKKGKTTLEEMSRR